MPHTHTNRVMHERYVAVLAEVLSDARAKADYTAPEVAALLSTVEQLPDMLRNGSSEANELMDLLLAYEAKHLGGAPKYTRILREGPRDDNQLGFSW
jgi:hypothetical protein